MPLPKWNDSDYELFNAKYYDYLRTYKFLIHQLSKETKYKLNNYSLNNYFDKLQKEFGDIKENNITILHSKIKLILDQVHLMINEIYNINLSRHNNNIESANVINFTPNDIILLLDIDEISLDYSVYLSETYRRINRQVITSDDRLSEALKKSTTENKEPLLVAQTGFYNKYLKYKNKYLKSKNNL
jgi:hypothetical protein